MDLAGLTFATFGYLLAPDALAVACIRAEARSESLDGQIAVGNVIRNRMAMRYFSNGTVHDTVFRALQFSWTNHNDPQRVAAISARLDDPTTLQAALAWRMSAERKLVVDAVLYHTVARPGWSATWPPDWALSPKVANVGTIGAHTFYRVVK